MSVYIERGNVFYDLGKLKLAENEFRQALAEEPGSIIAHVQLARTLLRMGKAALAHGEASECVRLSPSYAYGHYIMSYTFAALANFDSALSAIDQAISLDPLRAYLFARAANLHFNRGAFAKSLDLANQGLSNEPEHVDCLLAKAVALIELDKIAEADETLQLILSLAPENASAHLHRGTTQLRLGNKPESFTHFRESLRLDPSQEKARVGALSALKSKNPLYFGLLLAQLKLRKMSKLSMEILVFIFAAVLAWRFPNFSFYQIFGFFVFIFLLNQFQVILLRFDSQAKTLLTQEEIRLTNQSLIALFVLIPVIALIRFAVISASAPSSNTVAQTAMDNDSYIKMITQKIEDHAAEPVQGAKQGRCLLKFTIHKNGHISDLQIEKSSGDEHIDALAFEAISAASPFAPLPDIDSKPITIIFNFNYIPKSPYRH